MDKYVKYKTKYLKLKSKLSGGGRGGALLMAPYPQVGRVWNNLNPNNTVGNVKDAIVNSYIGVVPQRNQVSMWCRVGQNPINITVGADNRRLVDLGIGPNDTIHYIIRWTQAQRRQMQQNRDAELVKHGISLTGGGQTGGELRIRHGPRGRVVRDGRFNVNNTAGELRNDFLNRGRRREEI